MNGRQELTSFGEPKRSWKIEPLTETAQVSLGMASKVKRLLEDREWLTRGPAGFNLSDPAKLLAEWAVSYDYGRNTMQDFYSLDPIPRIEEKLADTCRRPLGTAASITDSHA